MSCVCDGMNGRRRQEIRAYFLGMKGDRSVWGICVRYYSGLKTVVQSICICMRQSYYVYLHASITGPIAGPVGLGKRTE